LLEIRKNKIGPSIIRQVYELARTRGTTFADAIEEVQNNPGLCGSFGARLATEIGHIKSLVQELSSELERYELNSGPETKVEELVAALTKCSQKIIMDSEIRKSVDAYIEDLTRATGANSLNSLLANISIVKEADEQHITEDAVNIMTMHKAKGLSADVVFVVAAEDEIIPGRQIGEDADDERRLLYVSLTRARHKLFVTYCRQRVDGQMYSGRNRGQIKRTLTQFLQDAPVKPTMIWSHRPR
jgi:superfamily I DNA/RNA helicase